MDRHTRTTSTKNDDTFRLSGTQSRAGTGPFERTLMQRFQHLMVCLTRSESDFGLIRYVAMLARLDTAMEVRFVHVLPAPRAGSPTHEHDHEIQNRSGQLERRF